MTIFDIGLLFWGHPV